MLRPLSFNEWLNQYEDELIVAFENQSATSEIDDYLTEQYESYLDSFEDWY